MRFLFLTFFIFLVNLHASNVLDFSVFGDKEQADIIINLDAPHNGEFMIDSDNLSITIKGINIDSEQKKLVNSDIITQVLLEPKNGNETIIKFTAKKVFNTQILKTEDELGLKIHLFSTDMNDKISNNTTSALKTILEEDRRNTNIYINILYVCISLVMISLLILLLLLSKRFLVPRKNRVVINSQDNWFLGDPQENPNVTILFKKYIDDKNYVLLFDFNNERFLVVLGSSNLLLEKYSSKNSKDIKITGNNEDKMNIRISAKKQTSTASKVKKED